MMISEKIRVSVYSLFISSRPIGISNKEIEKLLGHIDFYSATYRLFKIPELEPDCEDYGQVF